MKQSGHRKVPRAGINLGLAAHLPRIRGAGVSILWDLIRSLKQPLIDSFAPPGRRAVAMRQRFLTSQDWITRVNRRSRHDDRPAHAFPWPRTVFAREHCRGGFAPLGAAVTGRRAAVAHGCGAVDESFDPAVQPRSTRGRLCLPAPSARPHAAVPAQQCAAAAPSRAGDLCGGRYFGQYPAGLFARWRRH